MEGVAASQISAEKGGKKEVELKTSRYESHRALAAWLDTWRLFLGFPLGRASPPYLLCPLTNQDNINKLVYSTLIHTVNNAAQNC
jgi:hypothetical protein